MRNLNIKQKKQIKMKKIHGKMMKGITARSLMMLLALAGSNYCHAQQATPVRSYAEWQIRIKNYLDALKTPLQVEIK